MSAPPDRLAPAPPPDPPRAGPRRRRGIARYVVAAVFTLLVAVAAVPDLLFGLDRRSPFVQVVSMRPWILCGVAALLVLLLVVMIFERRVLPFVAGTLAVLLVGGGMVLPRMLADDVPARGAPLRVLAFNTFEGEADAGELAALIEDQQPDVVAISESGPGFADRLSPLVDQLGYRVHVSTGDADDDDVEEVTAVVSEGLGDVEVQVGDDTSTFPYIEVTGGELDTLRFVAFHSVAPVPGSVPDWNSDLAMLSRWCSGPTPAVIAGDFNATLDHSALRAGTTGCGDAAAQRGAGLVPTWGPSPRLREFGPQIDHVFATEGIVAESFEVRDIRGSDHRAVLATLRLATS
ncbi:endonuclease/exonuclease/phosphatase family protein [Pseudonocardia zijingensis]|jgi:endonuclease/exonuclease/phosphatase (EEP) superfamily protein YafD|uniref:Endonuclease/exonuclease/phosphatase domain-containing protein n=1 Tax=Pseudonocardia zijingensis TaxID=153376 RepID=A0ABP4B0C8_9PSEU